MNLGDHSEEKIKLRKISKYYKQYSSEQLGMCTTHADNVSIYFNVHMIIIHKFICYFKFIG